MVAIESQKKSYKYPKSIAFIVCNEFCERFCFYGMRTILALYLHDKLRYSTDSATVIYHIFIMFVYFFPVLGAMIADSWLGKFRTIFYLSIVYAIGSTVLSIGAIEVLYLPMRLMAILGLLLIALGTGGIKPCVAAFGGDQFVLPQQEKQLAQFFSIFYFAINSGSLISTFVTPILRADVHCFGYEDCYPLAFGVPGVLMIVSLVIFLCGKFSYKIKEPEGNILIKVIKCIVHAISRKSKLKKNGESRNHWLECADDKYDKKFIDDIKNLLHVMYLYIPLPIFWALYDQQGSRWTFQATRMNGEIGGGASIKPDQMQLVNPLLILAFIPLIQSLLYPLLAKCNLLVKQLHRLTCGGILLGIAFIVSALVELALEPTYAVLPSKGEAFVNVYNSYPCPIDITILDQKTIAALDFENIIIKQDSDKKYLISVSGVCLNNKIEREIELFGKNVTALFLRNGDKNEEMLSFYDNIDKSDNGLPKIRFLVNKYGYSVKLMFGNTEIVKSSDPKLQYKVDPGIFTVVVYNDTYTSKPIEIGELRLGGVYSVLLNEVNKEWKGEVKTNTLPNTVHMLWLIPQYVILTAGEVMFSVTGLEFSYSQAPKSMKSVVSACWLLTTAFGNLIVIIIAEIKIFDSQANEFFLFAGLMFAGMLIFSLMAWGYKYVEHNDDEEEEQEERRHTANGKTSDGMRLSQLKNRKEGVDNALFKSDNDM